MGNAHRGYFSYSIYKSMECTGSLGYCHSVDDDWCCILRNNSIIFLLSLWDFHVRTSSGKYAWMRGTAGCNDSFRNRAWTGLWNDRCCWNLMYCWSSDGIDGRGCVIRHYGFVFEGKKVLIGE
jgi:hypothetical protein